MSKTFENVEDKQHMQSLSNKSQSATVLLLKASFNK